MPSYQWWIPCSVTIWTTTGAVITIPEITTLSSRSYEVYTGDIMVERQLLDEPYGLKGWLKVDKLEISNNPGAVFVGFRRRYPRPSGYSEYQVYVDPANLRERLPDPAITVR